MKYSRKIFLPTVFLLIAITAYAQESRDYVISDIGWKITIPLDFTLYDFIDEAKNMQEQSGTSDEYSNTDEYDNSMDAFFSQTNIIAIRDRFNYFNITTTPFDPEEDGSWENAMQSWKNEAYKNMAKIIDSEKLDTASSIEYIDGVLFNKFHISVSLDNDVKLDMFLMNKLYRGYDCSITYLSLDNKARHQIELMLRSSRFYKN
jgi:hypothetical protein